MRRRTISLQTRITALALLIFALAGIMGGAILVDRLLSAIQEQQSRVRTLGATGPGSRTISTSFSRCSRG